MPRAKRCALPTSRVHTPLPRPNWVLLPRSITSSMSVNEMAEITGPKISSCAIRIITHIGEHRRWYEIALGQRTIGETFAPRQRTRPLLPANGQIAGDALELLLRHQRPNLRVRIR